jgi:hypothetical protein
VKSDTGPHVNTRFDPAIATSRHLRATAAVLVVAFAGSLTMFEFFWGRDALADISRQPGGWTGAIVVVACSALIHECCMAGAWHFLGRVP